MRNISSSKNYANFLHMAPIGCVFCKQAKQQDARRKTCGLHWVERGMDHGYEFDACASSPKPTRWATSPFISMSNVLRLSSINEERVETNMAFYLN